MLTAAALHRMSRVELAAVLARGHAIDIAALEGRAYRGVSLGLGALVERLTWKTFMKVFVREGTRLRGFNVRIEQTGLEAPYSPKRGEDGAPITFGHYAVLPAERGLLLDYGAFAKSFDPLRFMRDPVVAVNEGSADLLLGASYLELPFGRVATPSFFTLERDAPWEEIAAARP